MKKIFTLICMALVAMSANAQTEETQVFSVAKGDFNVTEATQTVQVKVEDKAYVNVVIKSSPYPDDLYVETGNVDADNYPIYDTTQPINPWSLEGGEESNTSIAALQPEFTSYLKGKGNPFLTENYEWEFDSDKGKMKLKDVNTTNTTYTIGCGQLPVRGLFIRVTPIVKGTIKLGVYINKGSHPLYILDESTKEPIDYSKINVVFYYQNNGFAYTGKEVDEEAGGADTRKYIVEGTLPSDYIIQHTNGLNQNRPALGTVTFDVEAGKNYMIINPQSQVGFYGFAYTYNKEEAQNADPLPEPTDPTAGIETVKDTKANNANAPVYNLSGQRVSESYKGVVIQNGQKRLQK